MYSKTLLVYWILFNRFVEEGLNRRVEEDKHKFLKLYKNDKFESTKTLDNLVQNPMKRNAVLET